MPSRSLTPRPSASRDSPARWRAPCTSALAIVSTVTRLSLRRQLLPAAGKQDS